MATPNKGWRVASVSFAELQDLEAARLSIESSLMRDAIAIGGLDWETRIVAAHHRLRNTVPPIEDHCIDARLAWINAHNEFHLSLLAAGRSSWLKRYYRETTEQLQRHHQALLFHPDVINPDGPGIHSSETVALLHEALSVVQHTLLMDAVLDRDADLAVRLLKEHVEITMTVYASMSETVLKQFGT